SDLPCPQTAWPAWHHGAVSSLKPSGDPSVRAQDARSYRRSTPDGRRVREVLTYSRRGNRLTSGQQRAWDDHAADWVIPADAVDSEDFRLRDWFGRGAPLIVEIGCGVGESTGPLAAA